MYETKATSAAPLGRRIIAVWEMRYSDRRPKPVGKPDGVEVRRRERPDVETGHVHQCQATRPVRALVGHHAVEQASGAIVPAEQRGPNLRGEREIIENVRHRPTQNDVEHRAQTDQETLAGSLDRKS